MSAAAPQAATATAAQLFTLIKNDTLSPIDAERYVPGKVIAGWEDDFSLVVWFRRGERFFKKSSFKSPGAAWENLEQFLQYSSMTDSQELSRLKYWATKGKPESPTVEGEQSQQGEGEMKAPQFGHRMKASEIRSLFPKARQEGARLIAYDSQVIHDSTTGNYWSHGVLFRYRSEVDSKGNPCFLYAGFTEVYGRPFEERVTFRSAQARYRNLRMKIAPLVRGK